MSRKSRTRAAVAWSNQYQQREDPKVDAQQRAAVAEAVGGNPTLRRMLTRAEAADLTADDAEALVAWVSSSPNAREQVAAALWRNPACPPGTAIALTQESAAVTKRAAQHGSPAVLVWLAENADVELVASRLISNRSTPPEALVALWRRSETRARRAKIIEHHHAPGRVLDEAARSTRVLWGTLLTIARHPNVEAETLIFIGTTTREAVVADAVMANPILPPEAAAAIAFGRQQR